MIKPCCMCKTPTSVGWVVHGELQTSTGFRLADLEYYVCSEECEDNLQVLHKSKEAQKAEKEKLRLSLASILQDMS